MAGLRSAKAVFVLGMLLLSLAWLNPVAAQTNLLSITKKSDLNLDTSVIVDTDNYGKPASVLVAPIFLDTETEVDPREWYRGLFYYLSSDRYNFKDIPFHYVLDKNGTVYEGIKGGVERSALVEGGPEDPIVVAYLANRGDTDFSSTAILQLENLLLNIANENSLRPEAANYKVTGLKLQIDETKKIVNLSAEEIFGSWKLSYDRIIGKLAGSYRPTPKQYAIDLVSVENPNAKVKVNAQVVIKIKVKNTGAYSLYSGDDSELILSTKSGKDSQFFLNNIWLTKSQVSVMANGSSLRPGQEATFEVKVLAPFGSGKFSDMFYLRTAGGQNFKDKEVTVSFEVDRGNLKILEITQTETGTLNVRDNPSSGARVIGRASPGQRYEWTQQQNGWYAIKYEGATGWILGKYAKVL
jgi:hypothetical protein